MNDNNYKAVIYTAEVILERAVDEVFDHLVKLSKWWPEEFEGDDIDLNTEFVFKTGDTHYSKNRVVEFVTNTKIVWVTTESIRKVDNYDWTGTKFIFELIPHGKNTRLRFTYDGVVLENESQRLELICDMTIKELFYNFLMYGKERFYSNH